MSRSLKDISRQDWPPVSQTNQTFQEIQTGAILRIADAVEKMASRYNELISERDGFERSAEYWRKSSNMYERKNRALRGHIFDNDVCAVSIARSREELLANPGKRL